MLRVRTKKIFMLIAVIGLLIFLHVTRVLMPVESFLVNILSPVFSSFYSVSSGLRSTYSEQTSERDLAKINKQLKERVNQFMAENARLKVLEGENKILREHLKFLVKGEYNYVVSNIVSRGGLTDVNQTIIIDKGSRDGLKAGLAIVNSQGIVVGKIKQVKDHLAEACLTTSGQCKLAVSVLNQDRTSGIVQGELGLTIKMGFIPRTEEVSISDTIITSGLEKDIPRGLVIGQVAEINKESNELWQTAIIEPLVDFDELIIVSVLLP